MGTPQAPNPFLEEPRQKRDRNALTVARTLRGFGAGALSVVFAVDLAAAGYSPILVGVILELAMGAAATWAISSRGGLPGSLAGGRSSSAP